jgi:hypothetical protein
MKMNVTFWGILLSVSHSSGYFEGLVLGLLQKVFFTENIIIVSLQMKVETSYYERIITLSQRSQYSIQYALLVL